MRNKQLISKLRDTLGLTEYEAKAYIALATLGEISVGELSEFSGVPRAKCYEVLRGLVAKGLVVAVSSKPAKYKPIPIEEGIMNRMSQLKNELQRRFSEARNLPSELKALGKMKEVEREIQAMLIENHATIVSTSIRDTTKARKEVLIALSQRPAKMDWSNYSRQFLKSLCKGVRFRFIVPSIGDFTTRIKEILKVAKIRDLSIEIRECDRIRMPFVVIDDRITYFYITDPKAGLMTTAIRVCDQRLAYHMKELFYTYWEMSAEKSLPQLEGNE